MKYLYNTILLILIVPFYFSCGKKIGSCADLTSKEIYSEHIKDTITIYYYEDKLFTGKCKSWGSIYGVQDAEYSYKNGYRWGTQKIWHPKFSDVLQYKINFRKGVHHGNFTEWWENGQIKEKGKFIEGEKDINNSQCFDIDGTQISCNTKILFNQLTNKGTQENLIIYYKNKLFSGVGYSNYKNGWPKKENNIKDGKLHGESKGWYENHQLKMEGNFKNGLKDGLWKYYYENGQLKAEENYKDGKGDGLFKDYYKNGQLETEYQMTKGVINGFIKMWYESGQLKMEGESKNGLKDGLRKIYYENGQLEAEENYKDGKMAGLNKTWFENGELELEVIMKNDEIVNVLYNNISSEKR